MSAHFLSERWRQEAALLRRHGAIEAATTKEACATELDAYETEHGLEALTLTQAAAESGYSAAHLSRALTEGRIKNVGEKGHPRIRRNALPRRITPDPNDGPDLVGAVKRARTRPIDEGPK